MEDTLVKEWQAKVSLLLFFILTIWWVISPKVISSVGGRFLGDFPSIYGIMSLWGAIWGIFIAEKWGGFKSLMGRAILMFSLGLLAQEIGQILYAYYSFVMHVDVPYPSLGDIGYFGSIPLYIYGVWLLGQASGIKIKLRSFKHRLGAIVIPLAMIAAGYFLFLQSYDFNWSNPMKISLDFGYPFLQAVYISLAILTYLLSKGILGGVMKNKILSILFGLLIQFLSDYTFLYQSSRGTWQAGGINDYMYLVAYFVMTISLIHLQATFSKLQSSK